MRYSFVSAALLALSSSVFAQTEGYNAIVLPIKDQEVPAGEPFEIVWQPGEFSTGTASITLLQGSSPSTLQLGEVIATGVQNSAGKFTWDVPADVPKFDVYGFKISREDDESTPEDESVDEDGDEIFQFSFPFKITGAEESESTSGSSEPTATKTVAIGTGPAYTPSPTPTPTPSSTPIPSANATSSFITSTMNTSSVIITSTASSNLTMTSSVTMRPTSSISGPDSTASAPAEQTANAGVANTISGSFALIGGFALAFAL